MTIAAGLCILFAVATAAGLEGPEPEYGHGLTRDEAHSGWISLFDGATTFGWDGASVGRGELSGGATTTAFAAYELRADVSAGGEMELGGQTVSVAAGRLERKVEGGSPGPIRLGKGARVKSLVIRPLGLKPLLNTPDGYKVLPHPNLPRERQAKWISSNGKDPGVRGVGGPGAVEFPQRFGDFVLQVDVQTRRPGSNGGVFFRCVPGEFMNGYEAQVLNRCENNDPARPTGWSTGAIDDRQRARRLVSRDGAYFTMTVVAVGPHVATWVNGYPLTDWTDTRTPHENPRQGLRVEPGTIQLQSHDAESEVEFTNLRVADLAARAGGR